MQPCPVRHALALPEDSTSKGIRHSSHPGPSSRWERAPRYRASKALRELKPTAANSTSCLSLQAHFQHLTNIKVLIVASVAAATGSGHFWRTRQIARTAIPSALNLFHLLAVLGLGSGPLCLGHALLGCRN